MKRKRRRRQDEEKPGRRRRVLRDIEDREWEDEIKHVGSSVGTETDIPARPEEDDLLDDMDWRP